MKTSNLIIAIGAIAIVIGIYLISAGAASVPSGSSAAASGSAYPCQFASDMRRGSLDLDVAISGNHQRDVWVDVFAPGATQPLPVMAQYDKTFTDSGDPYIYQAYSTLDVTDAGQYRVEATYRGKTYTWKARVADNQAATLYVDCG